MGAYYGRKMIVVMMIKDDTIRDGPWSLRKQIHYNVEVIHEAYNTINKDEPNSADDHDGNTELALFTIIILFILL
jgi:hypothetical protein